MSVSTLPKQAPTPAASAEEARRGLTFRSFIVCIFALLLMGMWNEYQIVYLGGSSLLENSPPSGAVTTLLLVLLIFVILYRLRKSLGLITAELIVIYAALLIAAPLMTQGLWHRLFGLIASLPHDQDFKAYESLPSMLWPHGENLCINGRFVKGLEHFTTTGNAPQVEKDVEWKGKKWDCPQLVNNAPTDRSDLRFTINRFVGDGDRRREILTPGENFLFSCLVKTEGFQRDSFYYVRMSVDGGPMRPVIVDAAETPVTFANPNRLKRIGKCPVTIPAELKDQLTIAIGLNGPGKLTVHDVEFFNSQAVEGAFTGAKMVRQGNLDKLADNERDFTFIKPDNMFSPQGLGYLLHGFIPIKQWVTPMIAWSLLIGALFMGFFGFNVIFRKQWVESERFTFPMNIFPRQFFGDEASDLGGVFGGIFTNRVMWLGFAVMFPLVMLKGLHFYFPAIPAPVWDNMWLSPSLATYTTNPLLQEFLKNANVNLVFSLFAIALLIETDILLSIWVFFFLFQLWNLFGMQFTLTRYEGYPWQWQQVIGAFIAYALLAIITARKHLGRVFRQIVGLAPRDDKQEVVSYRTAFIMIVAALIMLGFWGLWTNMGIKAALLYFGWILICGLTASKIRAEAGLPMGYWTPYFGMMFVGALGGFAIFGSTGMLVAAIASGFMGVACFFFIAPAQVEMMELGRHFKVRPRDIGYGLVLGLLGGLIIGGFTYMSWTYGIGADNFTYSWPFKQGNWYFGLSFRPGEAAMDSLAASGSAFVTPKTAPLDFINNINAKGIGIGFVLTFIFAALRGAFMWFPLHPLGYVLAGTHFASVFWFTCFLAWFIRVITLRIGGAHTVRKGLVPFSIGMFLACMASIIIFEIVGFYLQSIGMTQVYCQWP